MCSGRNSLSKLGLDLPDELSRSKKGVTYNANNDRKQNLPTDKNNVQQQNAVLPGPYPFTYNFDATSRNCPTDDEPHEDEEM